MLFAIGSAENERGVAAFDRLQRMISYSHAPEQAFAKD